MTRTRVKICGLRSERDLDLAVSAGADAIGLLCSVSVDSPREISIDRATTLARATPPFVTAVLVTMWESADQIHELIDSVDPDAIQLHGASTDDVNRLETATPVISALGEMEDDKTIDAHARAADAILLDSADDRGAGGTGRTHDWDRASAIATRIDTPVVLAGGLTPQNVQSAIEHVRPYAVDVASGVDGDGGKDPTAVRSFVDATQRVNGETA